METGLDGLTLNIHCTVVQCSSRIVTAIHNATATLLTVL